MTLVVARKVQGSIFVVGDTKLTKDKTKEKIPVSKGLIKTKLVSDHLAISFAGNVCIADDAIRAVACEWDLDIILRTLLDYHMSAEEPYTAEFIVASTKPTVDLIIIKHGELQRTASGWIGDGQGFELFRAYETGHRRPAEQIANSASFVIEQVNDRSGEIPAGIETYSQMLHSMKHVISDESAADVGGFAIPLVGSNGAFTYMSYADVMTHPLVLEEGWSVIPFGTAEQGGYGYDVVATGDHRGLSCYFLQGRFGIIYREENGGLLCPIVLRDVSPIEFEENGLELVGSAVGTYYADNRILCQRALDRLSLGDKEGALLDANRAIDRAPQHSDAWKCRGMVLSRLGKEAEAAREFERAVEVSPRDADAWNKLGICYKRLKQADRALEAFTQAIRRDPTFWRALANRATMRWEAGEMEDALLDLTEALVHQPEDAGLWRNRAAIYSRRGMPVDALACITMALQLSPDDAEIWKAGAGLRAEIRARSAALKPAP